MFARQVAHDGINKLLGATTAGPWATYMVSNKKRSVRKGCDVSSKNVWTGRGCRKD